MEEQQDQYFQILALTGGGYRGLYTAHVLEKMEESAGKPIGRCFDLIAGTSIGGILSLAVSFEVPMAEVVAVFRKHGERIFPKRGYWAGVMSSRYEDGPLREVISILLPESATLDQAKHALVIPALNLTKGKQQVLKTRHNPEWVRDYKYTVHEVALATAAAPIYFPLAEIDNQLFADGGLFANAPDLVALHEADRFFRQPDSRIKMLSVGTLSSSYSLPSSTKRAMGVKSWLKPKAFPLLQTILSAQQQFSIQLVEHRLGENYVRIDSSPSDAVMSCVALDKAGDDSQRALLGLASKDASDVLGTSGLQDVLSHKPREWIIREGH